MPLATMLRDLLAEEMLFDSKANRSRNSDKIMLSLL
jgi:hypothetical protein